MIASGLSELVQWQDRPKDQDEELIEFNIAKKEEDAQPIFVSASFSIDLKQALLGLLREDRDIFAWT